MFIRQIFPELPASVKFYFYIKYTFFLPESFYDNFAEKSYLYRESWIVNIAKDITYTSILSCIKSRSKQRLIFQILETIKISEELELFTYTLRLQYLKKYIICNQKIAVYNHLTNQNNIPCLIKQSRNNNLSVINKFIHFFFSELIINRNDIFFMKKICSLEKLIDDFQIIQDLGVEPDNLILLSFQNPHYFWEKS